MAIADRIRSFFEIPARSDPQISLSQYASYLNPWDWTNLYFNNQTYLSSAVHQTMPGQKQEEPDGTFEGFVQRSYRYNGIVFACMDAHRRLFCEATFQWRRRSGGRPGDLFGTQDLAILEHPWPGATTGDLLARAIQDADLAGNAYFVRRDSQIKRLRPDWVSIVMGSESKPRMEAADIDAQVIGYIYWPNGKRSGDKPVPLLKDEVAHFAPIPDPLAWYRGMSWLTPIIREVMGDNAASDHKLKFFENAATPNMTVTLDKEIGRVAFNEWVDAMEEKHRGVANAYRTLYLGAGATSNVVGANLRQIDFKVTQGAGETRIAAAAGVPPIIVGLSEGLAAATYSNYGQARRAYADLWARPTWRNLAGSLQTIVPPPPGAELWYDDRDIKFIAEDQKDLADIEATKASTIKQLIDTGFKADAVIAAVEANDMGRLIGQHTGLFSVQLQAPGSTKMPQGEAPGETPVEGVIPAKPSSAIVAGGNGKGPTTGQALAGLVKK